MNQLPQPYWILGALVGAAFWALVGYALWRFL